MTIIKFNNQSYLKVNRIASKGDFIKIKEEVISLVCKLKTLYEVFEDENGSTYFINDNNDESNIYTKAFNRNENTVEVYELIKGEILDE